MNKGPSQELSERERMVVKALHEARAEVRAPASLRARIEASRPGPATAARRRLVYGGSLAGALAAVVLALVLVLPGGTPGAPSLSQAAGLAALGSSAPAPAPDAGAPNVKLGRNVQDVYFPNWSSNFHWRAVGQRSDHVKGRLAVTVYYKWHDDEIAYTIVASPPLAAPGANVTTLNGTQLRTLKLGGRLVVTWHRAGHTCVLSGTTTPAQVLQKLAAWSAPGLERG
jgi:hypothetical protein